MIKYEMTSDRTEYKYWWGTLAHKDVEMVTKGKKKSYFVSYLCVESVVVVSGPPVDSCDLSFASGSPTRQTTPSWKPNKNSSQNQGTTPSKDTCVTTILH